jgi:DNA-binding NarL/FixJ family response regulator
MGSTAPKLRIFLADDHAVVREGLRALVAAQPDLEVAGEAADGRTACERIEAVRPDVAVMDVSMPELNGAQATERLKASCPRVKILALTVHEDRGYLRRLLEAGASGYVLKRAAAEELIAAIRAVAAGGLYLDPAMAAHLTGASSRPDPAGELPPAEDLSDRELEVVRLIARGQSNKEIAATLGISGKTVETYKARALQKLSLRSRADLVRYALRRGWLGEA